ncbi:unnamed protein product, partial [Chrysoparadoxa australica]
MENPDDDEYALPESFPPLQAQDSFTRNRMGSVDHVLESSYISPALQLLLVLPTVAYAVTLALWGFYDLDPGYTRELGPLSFAALGIHVFVASESRALTAWEIFQFWIHAACESTGASQYAHENLGGEIAIDA